jgi:tRNA(His) guanylyltransferase
MAKSKFEYVKQFELPDALLPDCGLLVRVDGHHFSRFVKAQAFQKPNDARGLHLMNEVGTLLSLLYSFYIPRHRQTYT